MDRKKKYDDKFIRKSLRFTPLEFEKIEEQRAYEKNLSQIAQNYQKNIEIIESEYKSYLEQSKAELEKLRAEQNSLYKQIKTMNESLVNLPNYESLEKGLKTLSNLQGN